MISLPPKNGLVVNYFPISFSKENMHAAGEPCDAACVLTSFF